MRKCACSGNMPQSLFTDVKTAADFFGTTPKHVYDMIGRGEIPATKVGRNWRIKRADLLDMAGLAPEMACPDPDMIG